MVGEQLAERVAKSASLTHKDRVHEFNNKLEALSESVDAFLLLSLALPRVDEVPSAQANCLCSVRLQAPRYPPCRTWLRRPLIQPPLPSPPVFVPSSFLFTSIRSLSLGLDTKLYLFIHSKLSLFALRSASSDTSSSFDPSSPPSGFG